MSRCDFFVPSPYPGTKNFVDSSATKTKEQFPTNYDPFFVFGSKELLQGTTPYLSYDIWCESIEFAEGVWGSTVNRHWREATPEQLSDFLSVIVGHPVIVVAMAEACLKKCGGKPYWILWARPAFAS